MFCWAARWSIRTMNAPDYRRTIAHDLLRQLLEEAPRDEEREQAIGERLRALVRAGRVAGLGPAELAEAAGISRPGVYDIQRRRAQGPVEGLEEIVLAAIGSAGATTRTALSASLGLPEAQVSRAIESLYADGTISFALAGYDTATNEEVLLLSPSGEELLDARLRRLLSSKPDSWTAYLALNRAEADRIAEAAKATVGRHRTALIPESTRSDMTGPELALSFDVADSTALFNEAARVWQQLRDELGLGPTPPYFTALVAPRVRSSVLEAFGRGAADAAPEAQRVIMRAVIDATPNADERTLCVRALTEAAWAMRRSVSQEKRPPRLDNGDAAFAELQAVAGLQVDEPREKIQQSLAQALERATDRLGPLPGRGLAQFRQPGAPPSEVREVTPVHDDLVAIARRAGEAVGFAQLATAGKVNAAETVRTIAEAGERG